MKKIFRLLLLTALTAACLCAFAGAEELSGECGAEGGNLTWVLDTDTGVLTISGEGAMMDWERQNTPWYAYKEIVSSVIVEAGVTSVGSAAFADFWNLTTAVIPEGVTAIQEMTFYNGESLEEVTIPGSVTTIGYKAFRRCEELKTVQFGGTQEQWETLLAAAAEAEEGGNAPLFAAEVTCADGVFKPATEGECGAEGGNLTWALDLNTGVLTISGEGAMMDWKWQNTPWYAHKEIVSSVIVEAGVTSVGSAAFADFWNLTTAVIPEGVTSIGSEAFWRCEELKTVQFGGTQEQWETLLAAAVEEGGNDPLFVAEVTCADGVFKPATEGECGAEGGNLTWVLDTDTGVLTISGEGAMVDSNMPWSGYASMIRTVIMEKGVTSIGRSAFDDYNQITRVEIPEGVTKIGDFAFLWCSNLTELTLPASLEEIGINALAMTGQTDFVVAEGSEFFKTVDGVLFSADGKRLVAYPSGRGKEAVYHVPAGVEVIHKSAFEGRELEEIVLSEGVTTIERWAFFEMGSLKTVHIPVSVTAIENSAFTWSEELTTVYYGGSEEQWNAITIGKENDPLLNAEIVFGSEAPEESESIVSGECGAEGDNLTWELDLDTGVLTISGSGFMANYGREAAPWYDYREQIKALAVEEGVTSLGNYAFAECRQLASVTLPTGLRFIGVGVFHCCDQLTSVTIPAGVLEVCDNAFWECVNLEQVSLPASVTYIGPRAFTHTIVPAFVLAEGCQNYKAEDGVLLSADGKTLVVFPNGRGGEYTVPAGVETIMESAFGSSMQLTKVVLPEGVQKIESLAFQFACSIEEITLPASISEIGRYAFSECGVKTVRFGGSEEQWNAIAMEEGNEPLLNADIIFAGDEGEKTANITVTVPAGAEVHFDGGVYTTADGKMTIQNVKSGTYDLAVKKTGCLTYTVKNITVAGKDIDLGVIKLLAGDTNNDGMINIVDMGIFRQNFGKTGNGIANAYTDTNGDRMVNIIDMSTFRTNFGKTAAKDCAVEYTA